MDRLIRGYVLACITIGPVAFLIFGGIRQIALSTHRIRSKQRDQQVRSTHRVQMKAAQRRLPIRKQRWSR